MPEHELLQDFGGAGCFTVVPGPGTRGTAGRPEVTARRDSRGSPG